jgi:hypothetical protein
MAGKIGSYFSRLQKKFVTWRINGISIEFFCRSTNSNRCINRKTIEFVRAAKTTGACPGYPDQISGLKAHGP